MLVLTRRIGQSLRIGESVEVTVVRVEGDRVVLGVAAPKAVAVVRGELLSEVSAEIQAAVGTAAEVRSILRPRA